MLNGALPPSLSDKAYLYFLTNTDHVEPLISFHLVFHTQVNLSHPLNSIESSYHARVHSEHLTVFSYKRVMSAFHLFSSIRTEGETSRTPLPKNKNIKIFCKVSWSRTHLPLYCKIILKLFDWSPHFNSFYLIQKRERRCK